MSALRLGLLSTAKINDEILAGREGDPTPTILKLVEIYRAWSRPAPAAAFDSQVKARTLSNGGQGSKAIALLGEALEATQRDSRRDDEASRTALAAAATSIKTQLVVYHERAKQTTLGATIRAELARPR